MVTSSGTTLSDPELRTLRSPAPTASKNPMPVNGIPQAGTGVVSARTLNMPVPLRVETGDSALPKAVYLPRRLQVIDLRDLWRIDDEWWRQEISRRYFRVALEDGRSLTLFEDLLTRRWYRQNY